VKLLDFSSPWFKPLSRRIGVTAVCAVWCLVEVWGGNTFWTILTAGLTGLTGWNLLYAYPPKE